MGISGNYLISHHGLASLEQSVESPEVIPISMLR
jgi:hypothetical protein